MTNKPQALLETMIREILKNDEDGAAESFAILIGDLTGHNPDLAYWNALSMKEAIRKVFAEREARAAAQRLPFGTASTGIEL